VREEIRDTRFTQALGAIFGDAGLLLRQELELAKEEASFILSEQARGAAYFGVAALFCVVAILGFCASAIAALIERGMKPSLACLFVAFALLALALTSVFVARSKIKAKPERTIASLRRDVEVAKEVFR
jgi:hypothetical protein